MKITWLGHAAFFLESGGYGVVIDPCKGVPGVEDTACEADAVYCSHGHFDHCYKDLIRLREGGTSPFTVKEIAAFHDDKNGTLRGENTVRTFTAEGITVAHMGDLGHRLSAEQLAALGHVDLLLIPVGGTYTLDAAEAVEAARAIAPRVICPMHYRKGSMGFDVLGTLEDFTAHFDEGRVRHFSPGAVEITEELLSSCSVAVLSL